MEMEKIAEELRKRKLPPLLILNSGEKVQTARDWKIRREEIKEILSRECYGYAARLGVKTEAEVLRRDENAFGGKGITDFCRLDIRSDFSEADFPFTLTLPKGGKKAPLFLYLAFNPVPADGIGEEILDAGYGFASVYYQDMAADYFDNHSTGLGRFCTRNGFDSWGKIRIWAWGAQRMLDVLVKDERVDAQRIAVMGHSRLGKTALVAGAFDTRFSLTVSCQSGGGGAALFRGKRGEQISNLYGQGSRLWFNGNFFNYKDRTEELPFDQHFLLSLVAPRCLYVSSAKEDVWADPVSEYLACAAASESYELLGVPGLIRNGDGSALLPGAGQPLHEGRIGYHLRTGTHYLSREDWQAVIAYREKHRV